MNLKMSPRLDQILFKRALNLVNDKSLRFIAIYFMEKGLNTYSSIHSLENECRVVYENLPHAQKKS